METKQQNLFDTLKATLKSCQLLLPTNITMQVGSILSQVASLEDVSQNEIQRMLDNQVNNTKKNSKIDEDAIKLSFCAGNKKKLESLDFDKDVGTSGARYREYLEYKEVYHYLHNLSMFKAFENKVLINRLDLGAVDGSEKNKRDKHLPVPPDNMYIVLWLSVCSNMYIMCTVS